MSEKEPAWKAELETDLREADLEDEDLWPVVSKHIRAAEQRGREAALREAAGEFKGLVPGYFHANDVSTLLLALIDPDPQ